MEESEWLVEIRLKGWEPDLRGSNTSIVSFEEVLAKDENMAIREGFSQFYARCSYEPVMRRKMMNFGITAHNCYASEAIKI